MLLSLSTELESEYLFLLDRFDLPDDIEDADLDAIDELFSDFIRDSLYYPSVSEQDVLVAIQHALDTYYHDPEARQRQIDNGQTEMSL